MSRPVFATILLAVPLVLSATASAQEPPPAIEPPPAGAEDAEGAFSAAVAAFDDGDFLGAAVEFEVAYRLTGSAEVAFNVGLSYDNAGEPARAAEWYRVYVTGLPEAPDRAAVEDRIAELEGGGGEVEEEESEHPLADHRLRVSGGWGFYPGGAAYAAATETVPVDLDGFRLELGYQYRLWKGLVLDVAAGGTFSAEVQTSRRTWDVWSAAAGLGWVWTSFPYVVLGVRGGLGFYAMVPNANDLHWLVPFRAGAWIEFPVLDWLALHLGGDLVLGAYVGRDDKVFGFGGEVGAGLCFSLGGDRSEDEDEPEPEPEAGGGRPGSLHGPDNPLGRGWQ
ncbi:MAG: hypothetical protein HY907_03895 [Deltaproteobacteria bacterium]|nr:hypothetical protein [Deltaproteobacteria bacterium]